MQETASPQWPRPLKQGCLSPLLRCRQPSRLLGPLLCLPFGLPLGLAVGTLATAAEWLDVGLADGPLTAAMWPVTLAVRWVWWVAAVTARLTPW